MAPLRQVRTERPLAAPVAAEVSVVALDSQDVAGARLAWQQVVLHSLVSFRKLQYSRVQAQEQNWMETEHKGWASPRPAFLLVGSRRPGPGGPHLSTWPACHQVGGEHRPLEFSACGTCSWSPGAQGVSLHVGTLSSRGVRSLLLEALSPDLCPKAQPEAEKTG